MGTLILRWFLSRTVRQAVGMCRQARRILQAQQDLLPPAARETILAAVAESDGELTIEEPRTIFPFVKRQTLRISGIAHHIWFVPDDVARRAGLWNGQVFRRGEEMLKLEVVSGDHLFVNRMTYNFRCPR